MAEKTKIAFGDSANVQAAIDAGAIDSFDLLMLDGDSKPKIGWIKKDGTPVIVDNEDVIVVEGEALPETGVIGKIYIFAEEGYFWNGTEFKPFAKSTDLTVIENQITELTTQVDQKVDATTVQNMIQEHSASGVEVVEF